MITGNMTGQAERHYSAASMGSLSKATGTAPTGWLGHEYGESSRTPQLWSEAGIRYVCDWVNDEQPYRLESPHGALFALPIMLELDDVVSLWQRRVTVGRYRDMLTEAFDTLYQDGQQNGRLMTLNLHPWPIGQPFRIGYLDDALAPMNLRECRWAATRRGLAGW